MLSHLGTTSTRCWARPRPLWPVCYLSRVGRFRRVYAGPPRRVAHVPLNQRSSVCQHPGGGLFALAPLRGRWHPGIVILALGIFGLGYSGQAWLGIIRDGVAPKVDLEDRLWYAAAPAAGFFVEAMAGVAVTLRLSAGCAAMAFALDFLLLSGHSQCLGHHCLEHYKTAELMHIFTVPHNARDRQPPTYCLPGMLARNSLNSSWTAGPAPSFRKDRQLSRVRGHLLSDYLER